MDFERRYQVMESRDETHAGEFFAAVTSTGISCSGIIRSHFHVVICVPPGVGQLVGLGPVDPTLVGEEQDPVVRRADEEVADDVVLAQRGARSEFDPIENALLKAGGFQFDTVETDWEGRDRVTSALGSRSGR